MAGPPSKNGLNRRGSAALTLVGFALLTFHTWAYSATVDFTKVDSWRRLWSDLARATAKWVEVTHGPTPEALIGPERDVVARGLILERIANQGLSPTRPLERVRKTQPFVIAGLGSEASAYDDQGRAELLAFSFRVIGGIAPFLILWLGFLLAAPVLAWTALELWAAGRARAAALALPLLGLSPFLVESLALGRYAVGFYLVAVLSILPLAVYARLNPTPTLRGLLIRLLVASAVLGLCMFCRSSAAGLWPGFVMAASLGVQRLSTGRRRILLTMAAAAVLAVPFVLVPRGHDQWQPIWEGLGDFDRTHDFTWSDKEALKAVRPAGVAALWTPESEGVFRERVLDTIRAEPGWYAGILLRRLVSTAVLWRLWPWTPKDGAFIRDSESPNEGVLVKYWTYTRTVDFLGMRHFIFELPVPLLMAPALLLVFLASRGRWAPAARDVLIVLACPALATLILPTLITTAGGQESQAIALVYLVAAGFLADVVWPQKPPQGSEA